MTAPARARPADESEPPAPVTPLRGDAVSDAELVRRAREDDAWARAAIYHRYAEEIGNLAFRLLRDRDAAADALQDTFVIALTTLHQLSDPEKLRAWLRRIAVNRARRQFRRRKLLRLLGLSPGSGVRLDEMMSTRAGPDVRLQLRRVDDALRTLSDRRRIVWTLRYVEGETLPAIAEAMGCSLATVKRELRVAKGLVEAAVEER